MDNKPITPTSKDISPEEIDKAVDEYRLKVQYDHRPALLYLHPYDFRMLRQICAYDNFVENEGFLLHVPDFRPRQRCSHWRVVLSR